MLRFAIVLAACSLLFTTSVQAQELAHDQSLIQAARAANTIYQRHQAALIKQLGEDDQKRKIKAMGFMARTQDRRFIAHLTPYLDQDVHQTEVVNHAIRALVKLKAVEAEGTLRSLANRADENLQATAYAALAALKRWGKEDWKQQSGKAFDDGLRASGVTNLGNPDMADTVDVLVAALKKDSDPHIRRMAAIGLTRIADPSYGADLAEALTDPDPFVRRYAAEGIVAADYRAGIPNLLMAMEANIAGKYMNWAVITMTGEDFGFDHRSHILDRTDAVERWFEWWSANEGQQ